MQSDNGVPDTPSSTGEGPDNITPPVKGPVRTGGRRTHRACDRCRVKKSKCNGHQPCNTCKSNERTCVFSALRRRDIRKWHCHMQDTVDEAIQRLYRACKESSNFPGVLPDERNGYVSTESILQAMGFTNLELGPRNGVPPGPGSSSLPPLQTQFTNVPLGPLSAETIHTSSDRYSPPYGGSKSQAQDPPMYYGVPEHQTHPNHGSLSIGHPPRSPSSTDNSRGMADQSYDAVTRLMARGNYDYPHHYLHPSQPQLPGSPQIVKQHFEHSRLHNGVHQTHITQPPLHDHTRSNLPWEYQERCMDGPPETLYHGDGYVNPAQVWPEYHGYTAVTQ